MLYSKTCIGGMVTAPHHLAAQAGAAVLREGGNAVEAMVAAAAAIAVVYPHMNGIGGDGFWVISEPGRDPVAVQACGQSAALATKDFYAQHGDAAIPTRGPRAALTVAGAAPVGRCDSSRDCRRAGDAFASRTDARQVGRTERSARLCRDLCGTGRAKTGRYSQAAGVGGNAVASGSSRSR